MARTWSLVGTCALATLASVAIGCGSDVKETSSTVETPTDAGSAPPAPRCPVVGGSATHCVSAECDVTVPADALASGTSVTVERVALPVPLTNDALAPFLCRVDFPAAPSTPATVILDVGVAPPADSTLFEYAAPVARGVPSSFLSGTSIRALIAKSAVLGATRRPPPWAVTLAASSDPLASTGTAALLRNVSLQSITAAFWDGTQLYVGDGPRVLVYQGLPASPSVKPSLVLGQPDIDHITSGTSASILASVGAIWSDGTRLAVANGNRVLLWESLPTTSFAPADLVVGQQDFVSNGANGGGISAATLSSPAGIDSDGTRLLVADTMNNRVLSWDTMPTRIGQPATGVLGQASFGGNTFGQFYQAFGARLDGAGAFVASFYTGAFHFAGLATGSPAEYSPYAGGGAGQVQAAAPTFPTSITRTDEGGLAVFDGIGRIAMHRIAPTRPAPMDYVLGQPDRDRAVQSPVSASTVNPQGRLIASNGLFIVPDLSRVLLWDHTPSYMFEPATRALGQAGFTTNERGVDYRRISGRTLASPADVAADATRIVVADRANNRVLLFPRSALGSPTAEAAVVLGQPDGSSFIPNVDQVSPSATTLSGPAGVALDATRLIVADTENHRVLVWSPIPTTTGAPATYVLGQSDFVGRRPNRGRNDVDGDGYSDAAADGMFYPTGVATDGVRLFVADRLNNRVLVWRDLSTLATGKSADAVLGQSSFSGTVANRGAGGFRARLDGFNLPTGVTIAGNALWVADTENNRVVRYDGVATTPTPAAFVGQPDGTTVSNPNYYGDNTANAGVPLRPPSSATSVLRPRSVALAGNTLFVGEADSHRVHVFTVAGNTFTSTAVLGQRDDAGATANAGGLGASSLSSPLGITASQGQLFVADSANHRVMAWGAAAPIITSAAASAVLGQGSFQQNGFDQSAAVTANGSTRPRGLAIDGAELFVAETSRNRVIVQDLPLVPGRDPKVLFGQPDLGVSLPNSGGTPSSSSLAAPRAIFANRQHLVVADTGNNRVLVYPRTGGVLAASLVLGQPTFDAALANRGDAPGPATLSGPSSVTVDADDRLIVADTGNHRILVWNVFPTANGQPADVVLGQTDFASALPNRGSGVARSDSVAFPEGVLASAGRLFVADTGNNRVLVFDNVPSASGTSADAALGQSALTSREPASDINDTSRLAGPVALAADSANLYVADRDLSRALAFDLSAIATGASSITQFNANSGLTVSAPGGIAVAEGLLFTSQLFVADTNGDRLIVLGPTSRLR